MSGFQDPERDPAIAKADAAVRAAMAVAATDTNRPRFHYHAPAQWMNDPNGTIFYKGWYHVFYQQNPYGDRWEHMHWGHARSKDLVHWEDLPPALWPSLAKGERHVFSGSVFIGPQGRPMAFYTSIGDGREPEQWIAEAEDDDLLRWHKDPVKITQAIHGKTPLAEWRDPFLFQDLGLTYMVVGGGLDGKGVVTLYKATDPDLKHWLYLGVLFTHPDGDVRNLECPNLALIDGKWVLLVSIRGRVEAFVGELRNTSFIWEKRSVLADGSYASQIFQNTPERAIHLAWVPTEGHKGWNGFLTFPSELHVGKDGTLLRTPVRELTKLRGREISVKDAEISGVTVVPALDGTALEFEARIVPGTATKIGVRFRSGSLEVAYEPLTRRLSAGSRSVVLPDAMAGKDLRLRVFLDGSTLDVYAVGGAATLTTHLDRLTDDGTAVAFFTESGASKIKNIKAWPLK